jgi:hypothetical protein
VTEFAFATDKELSRVTTRPPSLTTFTRDSNRRPSGSTCPVSASVSGARSFVCDSACGLSMRSVKLMLPR